LAASVILLKYEHPQQRAHPTALVAEKPGDAQVDEPALREGLPLKRARWESYLSWAVRAFRLSTVVADPSTQIVTHLCYSEFADILPVSILVHPAVHDFLTAGMTAELQSIRRSNGELGCITLVSSLPPANWSPHGGCRQMGYVCRVMSVCLYASAVSATVDMQVLIMHAIHQAMFDEAQV